MLPGRRVLRPRSKSGASVSSSTSAAEARADEHEMAAQEHAAQAHLGESARAEKVAAAAARRVREPSELTDLELADELRTIEREADALAAAERDAATFDESLQGEAPMNVDRVAFAVLDQRHEDEEVLLAERSTQLVWSSRWANVAEVSARALEEPELAEAWDAHLTAATAWLYRAAALKAIDLEVSRRADLVRKEIRAREHGPKTFKVAPVESNAVGGATSSPALFVHELLAPSAAVLISAGMEVGDDWSAAYKPILDYAETEPAATLLALSEQCLKVLLTAHAEGSLYP